MNYQSELLHAFLYQFLEGESALITGEGQILAMTGKNPVSYGTLPAAVNTVSKYFKLQEGDVVLLNDPYSGGSTLNEFTFVTAVAGGLLLARSFALQNDLKIATSVENEGLRVPPTPLRQNGKINEVILTAMQSHPACPPSFTTWAQARCQELLQRAARFRSTLEASPLRLTTDSIKTYLDQSRDIAHHKVSESASGETRVDVLLDNGEMIRLKLEISDGQINMDFGGTSPSKTVNLTDSATYGVCFYTINSYYNLSAVANTGGFSLLQVTKPSGCLLQAKYPAPTIKGMSDGVAALQTAIYLALSQIHTKKEQSLGSLNSLRFQIKNGSDTLTVSLPGGQGAHAGGEGKSGCGLSENLSVEVLEKNYPVKVQRFDYRHSLGGKGKWNGGRGLTVQMEVLKPLEFTWMSDLSKNRPRLNKNCSHGDTVEVTLQSAGQTQTLSVQGQVQAKVGDVITFCSGSGGGWGKAAT